jgi:4-carboxymuconolactone decarboxylase
MTMDDEDYGRGEAMRRQVLGDAHVDRALAGATPFSAAFSASMQGFVTRVAWGTVWTRDDLPLPTRSLVTLAMLIALNRPQELRAHALGALRNGCTPAELRAVLHQAAIYCGFPAALDALRVVAEAIEAAGRAAAVKAGPDAWDE